ncbi:hypothetical protein V5799_033080 [Amblyomma americanum]|uniref:Uncharacterized protein n=1 Tax=Amblyomma americanum TaxID=6943 RepID=A0AAQ4DPB5_AMBAM
MHVTLGVLRTGDERINSALASGIDRIVADQIDYDGETDVFHERCEDVAKMNRRNRHYELYRNALASMVEHRKKYCQFVRTVDFGGDPVVALNNWSSLVANSLNESMQPFLFRVADEALGTTDSGRNTPPILDLEEVCFTLNVREISGDVIDLSNVNLRSIPK